MTLSITPPRWRVECPRKINLLERQFIPIDELAQSQSWSIRSPRGVVVSWTTDRAAAIELAHQLAVVDELLVRMRRMERVMSDPDTATRRFVPPLGWPPRLRVNTIATSERAPWLITLNRYPRQIIGIAIRLPDYELFGPPAPPWLIRVFHLQLSIRWAHPARWWRR